jgi:ABC-2 type transport system permease protein
MHNAWLILKREYLERVRTKSFLISTLIFPALILALVVLPTKMANMKSSGTRHIVVASSDAQLAAAVSERLNQSATGPKYKVDVDLNLSEAERNALRDKVSNGELDGYLWLSDDLLAERKGIYGARDTSDFVQMAVLRNAVSDALMKQQLAGHGISAAEADQLLKEVKLETLRIKRGAESRASGVTEFLSVFLLVMMLYITVLVYGVSVMRSVLEEKTSRVVEVLLSSLSARDLMAGKVLGVGAVGLTQILIWVVIAAVLATPGAVAAASPEAGGLELPWSSLAFFGLFFVLGYLLYSAMFAALGAMVNSEHEAQQWQFFVTLPIIIPMVMLTYVLRQPSAPFSVVMSLFPLFAPILMYLRIVVQTPPVWQIALCLALMLGALWAVLWVCSRIYRVGILMYGKRPTLPEILKWLKYA